MKKLSAIILLSILFQVTAHAQQTYQLDIKKSKILWDNRKGMGGHFGFILFNAGGLDQWPDGSLQGGIFSIDMNSMRATDHPKPADNERVNKELRTPGFFDMEKYPAATMKVNKIAPINIITPTGDGKVYRVEGDLTIKGITNPIAFTAVIIKKGAALTATAKLTIDRIKWHIDLQPQPKSWNLFDTMKSMAITDDIGVELNLIFINKTMP